MALLLLDHKVDLNAFIHFGETPLHWASFKGCTAMIQLLFAAKTNIDQADYDSETPLHWSNSLDTKSRGVNQVFYFARKNNSLRTYNNTIDFGFKN